MENLWLLIYADNFEGAGVSEDKLYTVSYLEMFGFVTIALGNCNASSVLTLVTGKLR